jgi:hypothetical protein
MTPKKKESILGRAMLANVSIGVWSARKHDRVVTDKVNTTMADSRNAGRYHKRLFADAAPSHSKLVTAAHVARNMHYHHTLPWEDSGWRLLPTANYFEYNEAMRSVQAVFEEALHAFLNEYPKLVRNAADALGSMYSKADYPRVSEIEHKFHFDLEFGPVPSAGDFRVSLPQEELREMAKGVELRVTSAVTAAVTDMWTRLGDSIVQLRGKLDDGKFLRESMLDRLADMANTLGRLNLTNDPALEKARKQVVKDLTGLDIRALRDDDKTRGLAAAKADAILKSMKGVYTPAA